MRPRRSPRSSKKKRSVHTRPPACAWRCSLALDLARWTARKWEHVDFERRMIRLPDTKNNEPRTIHLSDATIAVLKEPSAHRALCDRRCQTERAAQKSRPLLDRRSQAARASTTSDFHDLRHSYASLAAARGVSLQMIGKLLGHKVAADDGSDTRTWRAMPCRALNDDLGAAMTAAIEKKTPTGTNVVKLPKRRKAKSQ